MERIDLYIQEVTRRLPEKSRKDIEMELRSTILDMMPDDYKETDVNISLTQLGDPAKLANQYRERPNYLIGPKFFDSYITILKMTVTITLIIGVIVAVIDHSIAYSDDISLLESAISFVGGLVGILIQALMNAFCWVTIIFIFLDRLVDDDSLKMKKWTPEDLKYIVPIEPKKQISKVEVFFGLLWTAIWATLYFKASDIVGVYEKSETTNKLTFIEPLFNQDVLLSFWPVVVGFIAFEIGLHLYKWIVGKWTNKIAIVNTIHHIALIIFTLIFFTHSDIFNVAFIEYIGDLFNVQKENLPNLWNKCVWGIVLISIITSVLDSIEGFRKVRK